MRFSKKTYLILALLLTTLSVDAKPQVENIFTVEKFIYRLISDDTVAIYKHMNTRPVTGSKPYTDLILPTTVTYKKKTYVITEIDEGAFRNDPSLYTLVIPKTIEKIRDYFEHCTFLSQFVVEEDNPAYCSEDGVLFNKQKTKLIRYPIWKKNAYYNVPPSVTTIGKMAFEHCCFIENVSINNTIKTIEDKAFFYCTKLKTIDLPNSLSSLNNELFTGCSGLTSVHLPDSLVKIGEGTFSNCSSLTKIILPKKLQIIAKYAFANCSNITEITFPNSLKQIGGSAFYRCLRITAINFPTQPIELGENVFSSCGAIRTLEIPNTFTVLPKGAFHRCFSLLELTIPSTITRIPPDAFSQCVHLKRIRVQHLVPPVLDKTAFSELRFDRCILEVPSQSVKIYKQARYWKKFETIVGF